MSRDRAWSSQFGGFRIWGFGCRFGTRLVFDKGFFGSLAEMGHPNGSVGMVFIGCVGRLVLRFSVGACLQMIVYVAL